MVITIIGILIALLLPAVQAAREAARQLQCKNNLKQLALACHNYENAMSGLPLLYSSSSQLGWITQVLPYFEQENVYDQYDITLPWFDAANAAVSAERIPVLECPTSPVSHVYTGTDAAFAGQSPNADDDVHGRHDRLFRHFRGVVGHDGESPQHDSRRIFCRLSERLAADRSLRRLRGPEQHVGLPPAGRNDRRAVEHRHDWRDVGPALAVSGGRAADLRRELSLLRLHRFRNGDMALNYGWGAWVHNNNFTVGTWSRDGTMQGGDSAINCSNYRGMFSFHPNGACAAFGDGSVHMLAREISPAVFFALVTARAGEALTTTPASTDGSATMNERSFEER